MKRLQYLIDQVQRTFHMLELNVGTMNAILRTAKKAQQCDSSCSTMIYENFQERVDAIIDEHKFLQKSTKSLLDRAVMLSYQVRKLFPFSR